MQTQNALVTKIEKKKSEYQKEFGISLDDYQYLYDGAT